ncbi:hypothetical protein ACFJIX_16885 [Roseateles sp. UC29_93]|uniref:hypothetical protein n=1 Tax=Roseateles sp. UC29_93 TaxID=3350177 RepID=UPI00366C0EC3
MTLLIRELERIDTRVLGALRCIDAATRVQVATPLDVRIAGATVRRNRSGLYVIVRAEAPLTLAAHEAAFDNAPATPTVGDVTLSVTVTDPAGRYLPRRAALALPRDPQPANAASPESLFRPVELPLYPSAIAPTGMNWSVLRLSVHETGSLDALGGALLLARAGGNVLARALTDWRGEALLPVPGVPVTTWSDDPDEVVVTELAARIEWCFDPAPRRGRHPHAGGPGARRPRAGGPAPRRSRRPRIPRRHAAQRHVGRGAGGGAFAVVFPSPRTAMKDFLKAPRVVRHGDSHRGTVRGCAFRQRR